MQTDLITKVYFNEHLTHSCVGMPQGLQALFNMVSIFGGNRSIQISLSVDVGLVLTDTHTIADQVLEYH